MGRTAVVVAAVVAIVALVLALQLLARVAGELPVEPRIRPFRAGARRGHRQHPPELVQLKTVVIAALDGDSAAGAQLAARLRAVGHPVAPPITPRRLREALEALPPVD